METVCTASAIVSADERNWSLVSSPATWMTDATVLLEERSCLLTSDPVDCSSEDTSPAVVLSVFVVLEPMLSMVDVAASVTALSCSATSALELCRAPTVDDDVDSRVSLISVPTDSSVVMVALVMDWSCVLA